MDPDELAIQCWENEGGAVDCATQETIKRMTPERSSNGEELRIQLRHSNEVLSAQTIACKELS